MSSRSRWIFSALAVVVLLAPAMAQQSPLDQVPAKSPIVVHLRGYERTFSRLNAVLKAAAPDYAPLIAGQIESGVASMLMGRELKGLPKDGPLFLVFTEVPTAEADIPELAVVAKVDSYTKFRDGLLKDDEKKELKAKPGYESTKIDDKEVFFLDLDGYAVVTPSEKAMKLFRDKKTENLASKLDKSLAAKIVNSDVSLYLDVKAITKQYGDQIDAFKKLLEQAFDQIQGAGLDKSQVEVAKKIYEGIFRLLEDSERTVLGVEFQPDGFLVRIHNQIGDKTKTNEILKGSVPSTLESVGKLPVGRMVYTSGSPDMEFMKGIGTTMMMGLGGAENKPLSEAKKALEALKLKDWASIGDYPNTSLQTSVYEDNQAAVNATLKLYRSLPEDSPFGGAVIKGKPEIKADAEKLNGFRFNSIKITWDFEKSIEKYPEQLRDAIKETLKGTLGESSYRWVGTDGKQVLEVQAKDWAAARKMVEDYLNGKNTVAADAEFQKTRKKLPEKSSLLLMLDANQTAYGVAKSIGDMAKMFPGAVPGNAPKAPKGKPTYIGVAVGMQPRNGTVDLWVPADAVKAFIKVFGPMFGSKEG